MARKAKDKHHERLEELIGEATIDCYNEAEEYQGFVTMIEENVVCPFKARVIGEEVEVVSFQGPPGGFGMMAVCRYKDKDYPIDINSLEWPKRKPEGFEWIEAYQEWLSRVG